MKRNLVMNRQSKGLVTLLVTLLIGFVLGFLAGGGCTRRAVRDAVIEDEEGSDEVAELVQQAVSHTATAQPELKEEGEPQPREIIYNRKRLPYSKLFNDLNEEHLNVARRTGLKRVPKNRAEVESEGLVEIRDNDLYIIYDLRYSVPYLTKNAARELEAIAQAFSDSLRNHGLLDYKLVVSSVLRTEEDVQRLRRSGNPNASDNSAHCYGTTFDIAYTRYYREDESKEFMQPFELTKVLGEVLRDRRNAGHCLVKYERQEHCFHITAK